MDFKLFLQHQREEMERYKWMKGVELGHDPGNEALIEWTKKYAAKYRDEYNAVWKETVEKTAEKCMDDLKDSLPGVSDVLWNHILEKVIASFTEVWTMEACCCDRIKKKHLEEI